MNDFGFSLGFFEDPVYIVDLVKECKHRIEGVWDMSVEDGHVSFTCAVDGLAMHYGMAEWAQDLLYTPAGGAGFRVRLGPVEMDGGGGYYGEPPEPIGIPITPTEEA